MTKNKRQITGNINQLIARPRDTKAKQPAKFDCFTYKV